MSKLLFVLLFSHLMMPLIAYQDDSFFAGTDEFDQNFASEDDDEEVYEQTPVVEGALPSTLPRVIPDRLSSKMAPMSRRPELAKKKQRSAAPATAVCYACVYSRGQTLKGCLDPEKYKQRTIMCHSEDDSCYTSVLGEGPAELSVLVRGCRSACVASRFWFCCQDDKCNNQPYEDPEELEQLEHMRRHQLQLAGVGAAVPAASPPVAFFVGVLLLLQTVLRVAFV